jgi:hypothetical protein
VEGKEYKERKKQRKNEIKEGVRLKGENAKSK